MYIYEVYISISYVCVSTYIYIYVCVVYIFIYLSVGARNFDYAYYDRYEQGHHDTGCELLVRDMFGN